VTYQHINAKPTVTVSCNAGSALPKQTDKDRDEDEDDRPQMRKWAVNNDNDGEDDWD
jgi:hypothetical protein